MLRVSDLMTLDVQSIAPAATLRAVVEKMKAEACRHLPVLDGEGRVVGIITDRDVRLAMRSPVVVHERWQDEQLLDSTHVETVMTRDPITVAPDTPAGKAADMLSVYKIGALPVVKDGVLVGIISTTDFLDWFAEQKGSERTETVDV